MASKKSLKLTLENRAAIEELLREVNGRASSFTVCTIGELQRIGEMATARLDKREVNIKERKGAVARYTPAGPSAKSYKFSVASTDVLLRMASDGRTWRLAEVSRTLVSPRQPSYLDLSLTAIAHARYLDARGRDFSILRAAAEVEQMRQASLVRETERRLRDEAWTQARILAADDEDPGLVAFVTS